MLADGGLLGWRRQRNRKPPALAAFTVDRREAAVLFFLSNNRESPCLAQNGRIIALTDVRFPG
jgi:hypothetical protein